MKIYDVCNKIKKLDIDLGLLLRKIIKINLKKYLIDNN
jgi:hypothetical protein